MSQNIKKCNTCHREKPIDEFSHKKTGYIMPLCRNCERERNQSYIARAKHKTKAAGMNSSKRCEVMRKNSERVADMSTFNKYWILTSGSKYLEEKIQRRFN